MSCYPPTVVVSWASAQAGSAGVGAAMTGDKRDICILPPRPRLESLARDRIRVAAPAKLNLSLLVGPVRPDGFHPIDSIVAKVTLYDEVELCRRDDGRTNFTCRGPDCGPEDSNLACRAAKLLQRQAGAEGADISLKKSIPPGAGLGGGSSDAAAALIGLNELWQLALADAELAELGAELGSDVPLFFGPPCCRATGRGEIIRPTAVHDFVAILILPESPCATAAVYKAYDPQAAEIGEQLDAEIIARQPPSSWRGLLRNDLASAARRVNGELDAAWRRLERAVPLPVCMTGSGSAMFMICDDADEASSVWGSLGPDLRGRSVIVRRSPW